METAITLQVVGIYFTIAFFTLAAIRLAGWLPIRNPDHVMVFMAVVAISFQMPWMCLVAPVVFWLLLPLLVATAVWAVVSWSK